MRNYPHEIVASRLSIIVPTERFNARNYGWTRLEVAHKFLEDLGLEIDGRVTMQVIQAGDTYTIRLMDA